MINVPQPVTVMMNESTQMPNVTVKDAVNAAKFAGNFAKSFL